MDERAELLDFLLIRMIDLLWEILDDVDEVNPVLVDTVLKKHKSQFDDITDHLYKLSEMEGEKSNDTD